MRGEQAGGEGESAGADAPNAPQAERLPPRLAEAVEKIERIFGGKSQKVDAKEVTQLRAQLEQVLGAKERWETPLLRHLFDALWQCARGRRRSAGHERLWLNLSGYCLRPGFGYPLDEWRVQQLWTLFGQGVQFGNDSQVRADWWTLWRRVAGGLGTTEQLRLLDDFALNLQGTVEDWKQRPPGTVKGGYEDMLRLAAALERIPAEYKAEVGAWLLKRIQDANLRQDGTKQPGVDSRDLWALGRIGARQPLHGSAHEVVATETVAGWLETILGLDWRKLEPAAFAAAYLARMTGDRERDMPPELRERIVKRLQSVGAPPTWVTMVREVAALDEVSERRIFGEALPPGLKLLM